MFVQNFHYMLMHAVFFRKFTVLKSDEVRDEPFEFCDWIDADVEQPYCRVDVHVFPNPYARNFEVCLPYPSVITVV